MSPHSSFRILFRFQISDIKMIKVALRETSQFFIELFKLGCNMKFFDVGGGLAVDYDGQ